MDVFKNTAANIGFWMIMASGLSMVFQGYHSYDVDIINAAVAGIGLGLMIGGIYKAGGLKK